ncbi:hypothetical protein ACFVW5_31030, partial [Streptomyces sp. NPDC058232]|uniref:hypothetical protein n=1 Tax=Streptomyces sp. NPDC058232 TaxID=3346393 RepID=UPI0036EE5768
PSAYPERPRPEALAEPSSDQKIFMDFDPASEMQPHCNRVTEQASIGRVSRGLRRRFGHAHSGAFGMHGNP